MWEEFNTRVGAATLILVAEEHSIPIAFLMAAHTPGGSAGLLAIAVEPQHHREGTGRALLAELADLLKADACCNCALGSGGAEGYFWPGVPVIDTAAWPFFLKHGWKESERSFDLLQDLSIYNTPQWVHSRQKSQGVTLELGRPAYKKDILEFEKRFFPTWFSFFEAAFSDSKLNNIVVALAADGSIAGTVLINCHEALTWRQSLGSDCGSLGVLGVAEDQQGRGVGLALAARAMELLKERGCLKCYIHWTGLTAWYGKLGTQVWAEYVMSSKRLS